ncbi:MAG: hypothetical protein KAR42_11180 [candidate division Zixibacteria bacterium]|nr:hypothetical protein [candidate division Zixibacteria bacterium]
MDYICTTPAHGLTVGETYTDLLDNPSELGACVKNDNGDRCYLPRRSHFIVKPTAEERETEIRWVAWQPQSDSFTNSYNSRENLIQECDNVTNGKWQIIEITVEV